VSRRLLIAPVSALSTIALAALTLAGACVSASEPLARGAGDPDGGDDQRQCGPGERPLSGNLVDVTRACIGASAALGCISEARACDDAESVVRAPSGARWWLGNLCVPEGFSALPEREAQAILSYPRCAEPGTATIPTASQCGSAGAGDCAAGQCPLQGHRIDEARGCVSKGEPVGCWPAGSFCPPQILFGRDAQGRRWSFPSGCLPDGFTRIEGAEQRQISGLSDCEPAVTPTPSCDALSVADCGENTLCKVARGIQYDPARRCRWPDMVELACVDFSDGCSTLITHASYADERVPSFQFPDSCIPAKYVSRPGGELVDAWPICPEAK
jgi:hypothetical protein